MQGDKTKQILNKRFVHIYILSSKLVLYSALKFIRSEMTITSNI